MFLQIVLLAFLCSGCRDDTPTPRNQKGEYIYRLAEEKTAIPEVTRQPPPIYPWEERSLDNLPKITKEFFRCKGSSLNPNKKELVRGEVVHYIDCGGSHKHSLPLKEGKEFIYPILIDLLNHIQLKTGKRVWITSGHRCPEHNTYVDHSPSNQYSKHQIGAEVSFYVLGLETQPQTILKLIMDYYKDHPNQDLRTFKRYEQQDTNVSTPPWFNKEVFVKLYLPPEGRDFDNRHPYPYLSIQVRFDTEKNKRVVYSWDQAWRNYLRF